MQTELMWKDVYVTFIIREFLVQPAFDYNGNHQTFSYKNIQI